MTVTLLNAKNFRNINSKEKYLQTAFGINKNVMYWKKDSNGFYARLSPIADSNYDGCVVEIKDERFIKQVNNLFKEGI